MIFVRSDCEVAKINDDNHNKKQKQKIINITPKNIKSKQKTQTKK